MIYDIHLLDTPYGNKYYFSYLTTGCYDYGINIDGREDIFVLDIDNIEDFLDVSIRINVQNKIVKIGIYIGDSLIFHLSLVRDGAHGKYITIVETKKIAKILFTKGINNYNKGHQIKDVLRKFYQQ